MRPSVAGMFDSKIQIWRPFVSKDAVGVEERTYVQMEIVDCAINRSSAPETDVGAGYTPVGTIRWYGLASIDVLVRDVCEVIAGPDAGRTWEVNEPPVRPRGHHTEVDCIEWSGQLPVEPQS